MGPLETAERELVVLLCGHGMLVGDIENLLVQYRWAFLRNKLEKLIDRSLKHEEAREARSKYEQGDSTEKIATDLKDKGQPKNRPKI